MNGGITITAQTVLEWFREIAEERKRLYEPDVLHVSEVTGCLRKAWFERRYARVEAHPRNIIYALGNGIHEALQKHLVKRGWQAEVECMLDLGDFKLTGHADLFDPETGTLLELKTCSKLPEEPYRGHVMQANTYTYMLHASATYIVYIEKRGRVRVFRVNWSPSLWQELLKRARRLRKAIIENRPPRPERGPLCEYCPYGWRCLFTIEQGGDRK